MTLNRVETNEGTQKSIVSFLKFIYFRLIFHKFIILKGVFQRILYI